MTPRVNLLPARYSERIVERRWAGMVGAALAVLLVVLGLASLVQSRQLGQAQKSRDMERMRTATLQAKRAELSPFRDLATGVVARERLLTAVLHTEVSWATLLTSLSQSFPADASLTSLTVESTLPPFAPVPPAGPDDEGPSGPTERETEGPVIGTTTLSGYSVREFTPGVERTLQLLADVTGLSEPRLQTGAAEELGATPVTTFEGSTFVDGSALTLRFTDGLPPEDDVDVPPIGGGE